MRHLLLLLALIGMISAGNVYGQITPNGNSGASTTSYTNGMANDPIYIWCAYGVGNNTASLTATPPSGTGPWTFRWYYHNQTNSSWTSYNTSTGNSSTISSLPSDGYRVEIFSSDGTLVGCYTAWVWNMNATIDVAANIASCNSSNLVGTLNVASSFSYYNPPPPQSLINASTQITVCFKANHTYVSDLAFYLVGPATCGSPVILLSPNPGAIGQGSVCNGGNNVNNLCFTKGSTATLNVCTAAVPLTGTYGRYGPAPGTTINWTPLNGCNAAAGGWRVQIYDCIGQDVGALTNATISFSNLTSVCGSPTTITYNSGNISSAINDNSCSAASASIFQVPPATNLTSPITINANTVYQWTASPTMTIPGATSTLTPTVTNIPPGTTTFTLTANVSYGGTSCSYTDNATFTNTCCTAVSNAGPDVSFCAGGSATIGTAAVPGRTYSWSPTTGLSNPNIAQPTVSLSTPGTTTYTLTVTNTVDGGCTATDQVNVTVNTTPTAVATPAAQTICSGTATGIALSSTPAGATFAWTAAQSGVTGASNGNGTSIAQTLSTTGTTSGTATYTITPTIGSCPGTPITVTVNVDPAPVAAATPPNQTICSGTATGIALSSTPAGATFSWTISQTGVTGASNGNGTSINQTLTATGTTAGNATYIVVPMLGSCPGAPLNVPITVNPTPTVTAAPQTICSGTSTSIALTSTPAGATFDWTVVQSNVTGGSAGNGTSINQTLTAAPGTSGTATYTITPTLGTCPGTPVDVLVTVNPAPVATATPSVQTICSGTATGIALSSTPTGATFAWTVAQTDVTGGSNGNGTSIAQTLTASGSTPGTATYTITPTLGTCVGAPITATVTVNPTPVVTATPANQTICSGVSTGIALTSTPTGATFDWTVTQSGVTGASAGNGTSINQSLTASGAAVGTATYSITPTLAGCPGVPVNVVITVNPIPTALATPATQAICSGTSTGIALTSTPAGATFDWTVAQTDVTGGSNGNGTSIAQVLNTTGTTSGTATYTITPTLSGCPGTPITATVTVNPNPTVTATPASATICSGTAPSIALTSTPAGATFDWTVVQTGVTGASAGSGAAISQILTASGAAAGTVTYTITPMLGTCPGIPVDVTITVNPTPVATATPAVQTICSGTATGIALTSTPAGATFDWTVAQSGVTGASAGSGTSISQTLTTSGTTSGTATYTITPTLGTCPGLPITVTITVNPTPTATATPPTQTICSGTASSIALTSVPTGATFDWTVAQSGVTGGSNGSGASIAQTLTASGTAAGTATYTITPTLGTCPGTPITATVTVSPTPTVTATPAAQTICSGSATGIALTSTPAGATFDWTVTQSGVSGASAGNGTSINQTLTASGAAAGTATYSITPTLAGCPGIPVSVTITVNPIPTALATPATQSICSGTSTGIALSSTPAGATFDWTVVQSGTSGASNGNGTSIAQVLSATGTAAGTATYTVTPTLSGCPGTPITVTVTVNPNPTVTATPATQAICSGNATGIALSSVPTGATFSWTISQTGATGASNGTGSNINQTLTATGATAGTVVYTVTPTLGTCPGTPIDVTITVNPTPVATATPAVQTICSGTATGIALTSVPAGATFAWTIAQSGVTGAAAGNGTSITQTLSTSGTASGTATYTITPTLGACPGTPITATVTVDPTPVVTATPATQTICSGTQTGIALTSVPAGSSFAWTVAQAGVTGASAGNGTSIAQTLTASGATAGTATYSITPTLGVCPGTPVTATVTVNPTPVATATPAVQTICSGTATGITLTSVPAGATFDWTVAQAGVTGASAGSGTSITQTLTTSGTTSGTATYTITPTLGSCPGTPITVTITVDPTPVATATPATPTICSGTQTGIALTSVPAGSTFAWTVAQSGVTGAASGNGTNIAQTLSLTGTTAGTATYTVTPTLGVCPGTPITGTVTVSPTPVATATPASQTICSGTATGIALTSTPAGATFNWTVTQSGVTGAAAGSGSNITQTLSTSGTTSGTATYTITPTLGSCAGAPITVTITVDPTPVATATPNVQTICSGTATGIALTSTPTGSTFAWTVVQAGVTGASAGNGSNITQTLTTSGTTSGTATYTITPTLGTCTGAPITVTITVDPTPVATATPAAQTICSGTQTGIALTSVPSGSTFAWTVTQNGVSGAAAGSGTDITQTLTTSGTTSGTATYSITPTLGACAGAPVTATITVDPTPVATATPNVQTICSGTQTGITLTSVPAGATFAWTVAQTGVTGAAAGNGTGITQTLITSGTTSGTATYTITPTLGNCAGAPITVTITVDPTPVAMATPATQTICSGTAPNIALTSVPTGSTFAWTVTQTGVTGASAGNGNSIAQTLTASGTTAGTATYTITPTLGNCIGAPVTATITVNPTPVVTATPSNQTICSGAQTGIALTSVPAGATFAWTVAQTGATGATAGSGNSITQTLTTSGTTAGTVTYSITPTLTGCAGLPVDAIVTVNPLPSVVATPASQSVCSGAQTGIALTSVPAGATFTWTVSQTGATGATAGNGTSIAQTLTASGTTAGTVTYTITPSLGGCTGPVSTVTVTVNPNPVIIATPSLPNICAGTSVPLTATGGTSYTWSPATGLNTTSGSTVNASPASTQGYTVTGTDGNGCSGTANVQVTVNPVPVTTVSAGSTICAGGSANLTAGGAASYTWSPATGLNQATGANVTATPAATTTYTVTGTSLGCSSTATVTVTVNPLPQVSAGADITVCSGETVVLSGSGAVSYIWSGGIQDGVGFVPASTTTYTVVGTGANGCTASDNVTVTVVNPPVITVVPSTAAGCAPVNVTFQNTTQGAVSYSWDFGDGTGSALANPSHTYLATGCFDVTLTASTAGGCTATAVFPGMVCVEASPVASFIANPTSLPLDNPLGSMVNLSENATSYSWDFGDGSPNSTEFSPSHTFPSHSITTYEVMLVAYSATGCTDTAWRRVEIFEDIVYYVPNAFTPDGDDYNQTFKPVFTTGFDPYEYTLLIYNRWGAVMFESHNADIGWDGTYGVNSDDILMDGTYVWVIEFKVSKTGERRKINGHVTVLR